MTELPPFPDDLPTQDLLVIDWERLEGGDLEEEDRLWEAATTWGFWYLKNYKAEQFIEGMFQMGRETLALPFEEKMNYWQGNKGASAGYKVAGATYADVDGSTDVAEFINVAKDDALSYPTKVHRTYPPTVQQHMASTIKPFISSCIDMGQVILEVFNRKLGLPQGTFSELHRPDKQCISESRCIKVPPSTGVKIALGPHTDFGSLSLLVNRLGGLQVLAPCGRVGETPEWRFVKVCIFAFSRSLCLKNIMQPLPGHAICNIGDTLNILSGGILKSCVHRVVPPPGAQADFERWSLVYFARPTNDVYLEPLVEKSVMIKDAANSSEANINNPKMTAGQWFVKRQTQHRTDANKIQMKLLSAISSAVVLSTLGAGVNAVGINCQGSSLCSGWPSNTVQQLNNYIQGIPDNAWYNNGQQIACAVSSASGGNSICAFLQKTGGTNGKVLKQLAPFIPGHGCTRCGSVPYYSSGVPVLDPQGNNNVDDGMLTFNYVSNSCNTWGGLC
ncbi:hypothetical protein CVT24_001499 [Panaeolus cyanescens]|uniref:Fe2OG dioxygenase domain-containing protein n=1 Tax=Panaeolus cyanescens TaxID=181874 RepID=A0A409YF92_9AGAR|nr:hypothetical protein CVT24_001499 [Panaeolus cyanescens]